MNKVEVQSTNERKLEKLIAKLRTIKGVRETSYRLV